MKEIPEEELEEIPERIPHGWFHKPIKNKNKFPINKFVINAKRNTGMKGRPYFTFTFLFAFLINSISFFDKPSNVAFIV